MLHDLHYMVSTLPFLYSPECEVFTYLNQLSSLTQRLIIILITHKFVALMVMKMLMINDVSLSIHEWQAFRSLTCSKQFVDCNSHTTIIIDGKDNGTHECCHYNYLQALRLLTTVNGMYI